MKTKTIYHVYCDIYGETEFFFDEDGKMLSYWNCNDANYRGEYMDPLMKALGIKVKYAEWDNKKFKSQIIEHLKEECGAVDEDFEV